jgi:Family of unknown function (DUF6455)
MTDLPGGVERPSRFKAILHALSDWVREPNASGVSCCGEPEIERIARDVRMSPAELRAVAKQGPAAAELLLERMAALDLDPAEVAQVGPQTFRDLQRVCSLCETKRRCVRDLARDAAAPQWQDYCPNAQTLMALDVLPWASRREW